jgi:hypothetical protein
MSKRTVASPAAGGPVRVLADAAMGAALIVTLGAARRRPPVHRPAPARSPALGSPLLP